MAGGAIRDLLFSYRLQNQTYGPRDIDVFCININSSDVLRRLNLEEDFGCVVNISTSPYTESPRVILPADKMANCVVTISPKEKAFIPIQLILHEKNATITEIVSNFDLGTSMCFMPLKDYIGLLGSPKKKHIMGLFKPSTSKKIYVVDIDQMEQASLNIDEDSMSIMRMTIFGYTQKTIFKTVRPALVSIRDPHYTYYRMMKLWKHYEDGRFHPLIEDINILATQTLFDDNIGDLIDNRREAKKFMYSALKHNLTQMWEN